ncbi:MAG: hypothetical protein GY854_32220 [Deltaproteobacteria bacterium]|nr:hypothetical protein [Deltaproteobacteria bacterium]
MVSRKFRYVVWMFFVVVCAACERIIPDEEQHGDTENDTDDDTEECYEGDAWIESPEDIEDIVSFSCVTGDLRIVSLGSLTHIDLPNLEWVGGNLSIDGNEFLESYSFKALTSVGSHLVVSDNPALQNMNLELLTSVQEVSINTNGSLKGITGFGLLTEISVALSVMGNQALESLDGFSNLTSVGIGLLFLCNDALPTCQVESLRKRLDPDGKSLEACYFDNQEDTCPTDDSGCPDDLVVNC